jgi:hypothetical protein
VESVQSIDEMKSVFIHQLTAEGGVIGRIRVDHEDTSIVNRETIVMNQAVRDITANIAARLPQECAALLEKALLEVYDILAPRICTYFNLAVKSDTTIQVTVAFSKLRKKWAALTPLYEDLDRVKHEISDNRIQMEGAVAQLRILEKSELEQQRDNHDDEWEFMDSSWTSVQLSQASKNIQKACTAIRRSNPNLTLLDIVIGKAKESIDWTIVSADTGHEPVETRIRITCMWKDNQIKKLHKTKEVT